MVIFILIKAFLVQLQLARLAKLCAKRFLLSITKQWLLDYIIKMRLSNQSPTKAKAKA